MVIRPDMGGITKIDISPLFLRHSLDSRVFILEPLPHKGFITFPCAMQRLLTGQNPCVLFPVISLDSMSKPLPLPVIPIRPLA